MAVRAQARDDEDEEGDDEEDEDQGRQSRGPRQRLLRWQLRLFLAPSRSRALQRRRLQRQLFLEPLRSMMV